AQLSGRIVFASLAMPEGGYIPTTITVSDIEDGHGQAGPTQTAPVGMRIADPGAVVSGRVAHAGGPPAGGGVIPVTHQVDPSCQSPSHAGIATAPIDASGRYELRYVRKDLCGLPFHIVTQDPANGTQRDVSAYVRAAGEQIVLDVVLYGRGSVSGVVRNLLGQPLAGANVTVLSVTDPQVGGSAVTDATGRYTITGITVGAVTVRAAFGSGVGSSAGHIDRAGATAQVNVNVDNGSVKVDGHVYKSEGLQTTPLAGIQVLYYLSDAGFPLGAAITDNDGAYVMDAMPAGQYTLSAQLNTRDGASVSGTVSADAHTLHAANIVIVIQPEQGYGTVEGTILMPSGA